MSEHPVTATPPLHPTTPSAKPGALAPALIALVLLIAWAGLFA